MASLTKTYGEAAKRKIRMTCKNKWHLSGLQDHTKDQTDRTRQDDAALTATNKRSTLRSCRSPFTFKALHSCFPLGTTFELLKSSSHLPESELPFYEMNAGFPTCLSCELATRLSVNVVEVGLVRATRRQ